MAEISVRNLKKVYDNGFVAMEGLNLEIKDGEFIVLVGPSGCGKSTLLRMIAGLEAVTEGEIIIDGKVINNTPVKDRNIGMVFQNYALYPHMNVKENMSFGLKIRKVDKKIMEEKVAETADILGLSDLLDRKPKQLSGGQQQRVALGRAMVRNPDLFLMDEPLSNLDAKLRVQMRSEIKDLHGKLKTTTLFVTHDQTEAMTMGTRIVIMKEGVIQQIGTPKEVYEKPSNRFVAEFIGSPKMNIIENTEVIADLLAEGIPKDIILGIRPENLRIIEGSDYIVNMIENLGSLQYIYAKNDHLQWVLQVNRDSDYRIGDKVGVQVCDKGQLNFFDRESEERIEDVFREVSSKL